MAGTKISALTVANSVTAADLIPIVQSSTTKQATASLMRLYVGAGLTNASTSTVSGAFAVDTYLAGSAITTPYAGTWAVGTIYQCQFDMVKTAAGTAALVVTVRMGTLGTTGDASVISWTFSAGTAAVDRGLFGVQVAFRSVGSGTSAVLAGWTTVNHHLASGGFVTDGAAGFAMQNSIGSGFNSTTQTIIGVSVNGGASFSGTTQLVTASALKI